MFVQRRSRNLLEAAFRTGGLIYHQAVFNLRQTHANAVIGLVLTMIQSSMMILMFMAMYWVIGVRSSPIRGDFILFIMSGIFVFMTFNQAMARISGSGKSTSALMKHGPMNTAIAMCGAGLAALYNSVLSALVLLGLYHTMVNPVHLENWRGALAMLVLGWFLGCCLGLIMVSVTAWFPEVGRLLSPLIRRVNMVASGKMFAANMMPSHLLAMFDWNPLFHIIDQARGYAFINYNPRNSSLEYPIYVTLALIMVGLVGEFHARKNASISWTAGR